MVESKNKVELMWLGHAGFRLRFPTPTGEEFVIYIDPWLKNPQIPDCIKYHNGGVPDDANLVLVSGHFDHVTQSTSVFKASKKPNPMMAAYHGIS
jgi:L-ascorbate metabolism protein UlaG (beta-lactamase superfamily)